MQVNGDAPKSVRDPFQASCISMDLATAARAAAATAARCGYSLILLAHAIQYHNSLLNRSCLQHGNQSKIYETIPFPVATALQNESKNHIAILSLHSTPLALSLSSGRYKTNSYANLRFILKFCFRILREPISFELQSFTLCKCITE